MSRKILILMLFSIIIFTACDISAKAEEQRKVSGSPNLAGAYQEMNTPEFWISGIA